MANGLQRISVARGVMFVRPMDDDGNVIIWTTQELITMLKNMRKRASTIERIDRIDAHLVWLREEERDARRNIR